MTKNTNKALIIFALILIALNIIFTSNEINLGYWLRLLSLVLLVANSVINIHKENRKSIQHK